MQGGLKKARGLEKSASRTRESDATSVDFAELKTLKKMI